MKFLAPVWTLAAVAAVSFSLQARAVPSAAAAPSAVLPADAAPQSAPAIPSPPAVDAHAYILLDYASAQVLAAQNADMRMAPASLTKLMTCYVVFHALATGTLKPDEPITISEHAWRAEGSRTFLKVGSQVPAEVLIKGMIVQSGNDATIALAERVGGTEPAFVQLMNEYARRLGMVNTHFDDSTGLPSPTHYTTAHDLALLARALIHDYPQYYSYFSMREFVWNNIRQQNRNGLLGRDPTVDGLKTGHTDAAGYCLVTSAKRGNMRLIAVVLDAGSIKGREDASAALLNYGYTFYETISVEKAGATVLRPRVYKAGEQYYAIGPATDVNVVVPRELASSIQTNAVLDGVLIAPLTTTTPVGQLEIAVGGKPVRSVPLFPISDVPQGGWWTRMTDTMRLWTRRHK
ncbi:MAG TPA: D-alanyl-D-alanine carboxypeptidase family protein [Steroidobacteraceae bacterium]|jgi:D-alanyl-D-alanine carboxypeptidase (penicillin-binding protein 5/6)|nr:D-alanyl-D-alanine carboxypeptidase family protein [Steroidobacteraceae bacterium]